VIQVIGGFDLQTCWGMGSPDADVFGADVVVQLYLWVHCGGKWISRPYFGATFTSFSIAAGGTDSSFVACPTSAKYRSSPDGLTRISIFAGIAPVFLKACSVPLGRVTQAPVAADMLWPST